MGFAELPHTKARFLFISFFAWKGCRPGFVPWDLKVQQMAELKVQVECKEDPGFRPTPPHLINLPRVFLHR